MSNKLDDIFEEEIIFASISERKKDTHTGYINVKISPFVKKGAVCFQFAFSDGKKVFHKNLNKSESVAEAGRLLNEDFNQLAVFTELHDYHITSYKAIKINASAPTKIPKNTLSHNREKSYILKEGIPHDFLVYLGVMNSDGTVIKSKYDKYRQINRYLEFVDDVLADYNTKMPITIVDFGCGKAYLTFALYYYLVKIRGIKAKITGLDIKEDVISFCSDVAKALSYDNLEFLNGRISDYSSSDNIDMVITLHACDNATDDAIAKAVAWNAKIIMTVPCCQHEVAGKLNESYLPVLSKHGIIRERLCTLITDSLRAQLLEAYGYKTSVMEFIDMEHTPKNILIRGIKKGGFNEKAYNIYKEYVNGLGIDFYLEKQLEKVRIK